MKFPPPESTRHLRRMRTALNDVVHHPALQIVIVACHGVLLVRRSDWIHLCEKFAAKRKDTQRYWERVKNRTSLLHGAVDATRVGVRAAVGQVSQEIAAVFGDSCS